jgi:hypothetical protein
VEEDRLVETYAGTWWIADHRPEQEVRRVEGTLTIDDHGRAVLLTSDYVGLLLEPVNGVLRATSSPSTALVVHGRLTGGGLMTLLRVSGEGQALLAQAVLEDVWLMPGRPDDLADAATVPADRRGELVPGEETEVFAGIDVEIEHLGEWSASASLTRVVPVAPQERTVPLLTRSVHTEPTASLPDGTTVALRSRVSQQTQHRAGGSLIVTTETIVARITTSRPASLNSLLGYVSTVRRLVGLAVRREVGVISAVLRLADPATVAQPSRVGDDVDQPPVPLHKQFLPVGNRDSAVVEHHRMLFTLADLPFTEVLPRWTHVAQDLRGTVAALVAAHDTNALLETRLIAAVTAAENLFARTRRSQRLRRMPDADFARLREVVLAALDGHPDLRQYDGYLRESIQNQPTLRQRLRLLVDDLGEHADQLLCGDQVLADSEPDHNEAAASENSPRPSECREAQAWAWAAAKGRNEIAHEGLTPSLDTSAALAALDTTVALVELLILRELGMTDDLLAGLIRNRHYHVPGRIRDHLEPLFRGTQSGGGPGRASTTDAPAHASDELVEEHAENDEDRIAPLVAAVFEVAGAHWHRGWVPWQAVTAAARRHGALPATADQHDDLQTALAATFGPATPTPSNGRNPNAGLGYSTLALFVSVNNHIHATGQPFPNGRWRRHRALSDIVATLPVVASILADPPADPDALTTALTSALDEAGLPARDHTYLTTLAARHADEVMAWLRTAPTP